MKFADTPMFYSSFLRQLKTVWEVNPVISEPKRSFELCQSNASARSKTNLTTTRFTKNPRMIFHHFNHYRFVFFFPCRMRGSRSPPLQAHSCTRRASSHIFSPRLHSQLLWVLHSLLFKRHSRQQHPHLPAPLQAGRRGPLECGAAICPQPTN